MAHQLGGQRLKWAAAQRLTSWPPFVGMSHRLQKHRNAREFTVISDRVELGLMARIEAYGAANPRYTHVAPLCNSALRHLEYYLARYFPAGKKLSTAETGGGASTLLFATYSAAHVVFSPNAPYDVASGIHWAQQFPTFSAAKVTIFPGATDRTLVQRPIRSPLHIVLIDGMRTFPHPELEFFALASQLQIGGILAINGLDVPTIKSMYDTIASSDRFVTHGIVGTTGFLQRTSARFAPHSRGDDWWRIGVNTAQFPAVSPNAYSVGVQLPFRFSDNGFLRSLEPFFGSGFALSDGVPIAQGNFCTARVPLAQLTTGELQLRLKLRRPRLAAVATQKPVALEIYVETGVAQPVVLVPGDVTIFEHCFTVDAATSIAIKFATSDIETMLHPPGKPEVGLDPINTLFELECLELRVADTVAAADVAPMQRFDGSITDFEAFGQPFRFMVTDAHDSIQAHHFVGQLYEIEELELLRQHLRPGLAILDVGANIGNHTAFFEKVLGASRIVPIELQPRIMQLFRLNCMLNELRNVDFSHLGFGLGAAEHKASTKIEQAFNPAGAKLVEDSAGAFEVRIGDKVFPKDHFDFIKIDVEGMEVEVLRGLMALIKRCRPTMFVEVWDHRRAECDALIAELDYAVVAEYRRYGIATNLLLRPQGALSG
jgi:FkbM family methyltransferase